MSKPADPLADLRQEDAGLTTQTAAALPTDPAAPPVPEDLAPVSFGVTDAEWHQAVASSIVERWHMDRTALAQLHGGGTCGCRYAASLALIVLAGPPVPTPEPEADPDAQGDGS